MDEETRRGQWAVIFNEAAWTYLGESPSVDGSDGLERWMTVQIDNAFGWDDLRSTWRRAGAGVVVTRAVPTWGEAGQPSRLWCGLWFNEAGLRLLGERAAAAGHGPADVIQDVVSAAMRQDPEWGNQGCGIVEIKPQV